MKEARYFYVPQARESQALPPEEAAHAVRVLRLSAGDEIFLMDGEGSFYDAHVTEADKKHCFYEIDKVQPQSRSWKGRIHLAIAPTKMMERMEWLAEKATEIGFDELTFLNCDFSERRQVRIDRIDKIIVSAMKQSRKPWKPVLHGMTSFHDFIANPRSGHCFIAHCYDEVNRVDLYHTLSKLSPEEDVTILVGPEGDFSIHEVQAAIDAGYCSISLGSARLRTETAGLYSVMMAQLVKRTE
ncbi:MAG: 16S rRNA (uracil(1498)-N(3))-methyltransferase [Prevotella sp.]|jgi:16S rRNA (uracil1498-N3)-methyltransferase